MHAPGPWGRAPSLNSDLANETLLDAVEDGMPALRAYARDVEAIAEPDASEIAELLDEAERHLVYVDHDRFEELSWSIRHLRGQLAAVPAALAAA